MPQSSWAVATPVMLVVVTAGHSRILSGGQVMVGEVVSFTATSVVHALEQPLLITVRLRVKLVPQAVPAVTATVRAFVAPEMLPLPRIVQAKEVIPVGA